MHDIVIREVTIYDGGGGAARQGDLAIEGAHVAQVGPVSGAAREEIDGRGLSLAPGFIDVHTHDDFAAVVHKDMAFKTMGGVTTCVVGNCGMGAAPWNEAMRMARAFHPQTLPQWNGYRGYLELLEREPPGVNVAVLIGHGTARQAAMGSARRAPNAAEMRAMKDIVREGLDAGAVGLSTGLIYDPGRYAQTDEIVELASLMRGTGALYATHMRDEGLNLLKSVEEAIAIGERSQVPVQISHHKASGREAWGLVSRSLRLIEDAQARGLDVHADQYPYTAGSTILSAIYRDADSEEGGLGRVEPDAVVIASAPSHREWEGKSVAQIALAMGTDVRATVARMLAEEPGATAVIHTMCEDDVRTVMRHASTMIGSDGLPTLEGKPHPRLFGTFARVLGHYARDEGLFSLSEAIYRMTRFPAKKFGLLDRGRIEPGARADLVLFDEKTILDLGTFEKPNQTPRGISTVFVNGALTVREGKATGARAGEALRRRH